MRSTMAGGAWAFALITIAAVCRADDGDDARAVYAQGKAAYDRGDYQEALVQFSRAHALRPAPALLFNMAQASRLSGKGHCAEALDLYERYLREDPAPENRTEVEERVSQMRACAREESTAAAPPPVPVPASAEPSRPPAPEIRAPVPPTASVQPRPDSRRELRKNGGPPGGAGHSPPLAAVLATGIGASLAIAGGVLYLRARSEYAEAESRCPCPEGAYSDWEALTTASYALMASGAAAAGTGATFWILSGRDGESGTKGAGAGVRFKGRF